MFAANLHYQRTGIMDERRKKPRMRALKAGKIIFNLRSCVVDCTVRNLTGEGALLVVPSQVGIPDSFELVMASDQARHNCRVTWRGEDRLGVAFG
jgi:PilZ domain-containing protein